MSRTTYYQRNKEVKYSKNGAKDYYGNNKKVLRESNK